MKNQITTGGNLPVPGQKRPNTIVLTQTRRFNIDISNYMSAIRAAENIDFCQRTKYVDLCEDILMDAHLSSVLNKRKSAILCTPIEFRRAGKPDERINEMLRSPWFYHFQGDVFDALMQGSTLVQFFRDQRSGWPDYSLVPRKHYDPVRRLILKRQTDITGTPWDDYDDLLFIGQPRALGELAKAAPWVIYKRNTTADWSQFSEIFGMPIRKYTYEMDDDEALARLMEDAENQGSETAFFMPTGCNMDLLESGNKSGSADLYKQLVDTCNAEISKLILGNTLTTEAGTRGSQALGTVHGKVEDRLAQADRKFILNVLNYDMTDIFQRMGIDTQGGEFVFSEPKNIDAEKKMQLFEKANLMGLAISQDQMYDELGLERPTQTNRLQEPVVSRADDEPLEKEKEKEKEKEPEPEDKNKKNAPKSPVPNFRNWLNHFFVHAPEDKNHGAPLAF